MEPTNRILFDLMPWAARAPAVLGIAVYFLELLGLSLRLNRFMIRSRRLAG